VTLDLVEGQAFVSLVAQRADLRETEPHSVVLAEGSRIGVRPGL
jgi:hypothetical protein